MAGFTTAGLIFAIGAGVQAYGTWRASRQAARASEEAGAAERRAAESQAALADWNAGIADLQAKDAIERGAEDESRFRQYVRQMVGSQRAGFAAANVDVGFGSALEVQADAAMLGELDALTIRTNAAREAWGFQVQAQDLRQRAEIARSEGVMLEEAGRTQAAGQRAAGTLGAIRIGLGAGSSLLQQRYGFGRQGGATSAYR
jgi:hypothetical protein